MSACPVAALPNARLPSATHLMAQAPPERRQWRASAKPVWEPPGHEWEAKSKSNQSRIPAILTGLSSGALQICRVNRKEISLTGDQQLENNQDWRRVYCCVDMISRAARQETMYAERLHDAFRQIAETQKRSAEPQRQLVPVDYDPFPNERPQPQPGHIFG